jgi:hypothetical protein
MLLSTKRGGFGNFDAVIGSVGARLLSERTFDLVLAPALADYQIETGNRRGGGWAGRCAVLVALTGGLRIEVARHAGSFFALALLPLCHNIVLLTMFSDFFDMTTGVRFIGAMILVLSLGPVLLCFWPGRRIARPTE